MTGVFGPGPRDMAVCHAVARPTHDYKNPLPLSQVRTGGQAWRILGERRPLAGAQGALLPPEPHPPPNALFSDGWAGSVRGRLRASDGPPALWERAIPGKMWRKARWCPMPRGGTQRERGTKERRMVRCLLLSRGGPSAGQGREERRQTGSLCGALEGWRGHEEKGSFFTGDDRRRPRGLPVMTQVAPGTGSGDDVPFPLSKDQSSRPIPDRWPCP